MLAGSMHHLHILYFFTSDCKETKGETAFFFKLAVFVLEFKGIGG